jgi:hypothetical protein
MQLGRTTIERLFLGLIILLAATLTPEAMRVGLWRSGMPGPGLYPLLLLAMILGISLVLSLPVRAAPDSEPPALRVERPGDIAIILFALVAATILMPFLGFRVVVLAFSGILMVWLARQLTLPHIAIIIAMAAVLSFGLYSFFASVFRVYLPVGRLTGL